MLPRLKSAISPAGGLRSRNTRSAAANAASRSVTIAAPPARYSPSEMCSAAPSPASTSTSAPSAASFATVAGMSEMRVSPASVSFGMKMRTAFVVAARAFQEKAILISRGCCAQCRESLQLREHSEQRFANLRLGADFEVAGAGAPGLVTAELVLGGSRQVAEPAVRQRDDEERLHGRVAL